MIHSKVIAKQIQEALARARVKVEEGAPTPTPEPEPTPRPPTVTIDVSKLPTPFTIGPSITPTISPEPVPSAVLEWAGLVYSWQRTPEAVAGAMKRWREMQARKAEVSYVERYRSGEKLERIEELGEEVEFEIDEQRERIIIKRKTRG